MRFPDAFFCCLRGEQNHAFSFMEHEELDQHETHERLAETHAVAEESAAAPTAFNDFVLAYDALKAMPCVVANNLTGQPLGGKTLAPGIYCFPSTTADLTTGTLTLDAGGDSNAVWVFQVGTGITTGTASVAMINGWQQRNVFWQIGTAATIGTGTAFKGNILAGSAITFTGANTSPVGRALAKTAVTMTDALISQ